MRHLQRISVLRCQSTTTFRPHQLFNSKIIRSADRELEVTMQWLLNRFRDRCIPFQCNSIFILEIFAYSTQRRARAPTATRPSCWWQTGRPIAIRTSSSTSTGRSGKSASFPTSSDGRSPTSANCSGWPVQTKVGVYFYVLNKVIGIQSGVQKD